MVGYQSVYVWTLTYGNVLWGEIIDTSYEDVNISTRWLDSASAMVRSSDIQKGLKTPHQLRWIMHLAWREETHCKDYIFQLMEYLEIFLEELVEAECLASTAESPWIRV